MPRVSKTTNALYNGVSQQPAGLRLESQVDQLINMWPDVGKGLTRRPPTAHVSRTPYVLPTGWDATAGHLKTVTHKINKSIDEQYIVNFTTDALAVPTTEIHVSDLAGAELPVIYDSTAAQDYIEAAPNSHGAGGFLRAVSVLDTTFIANTSVVPAMTSDLTQWGQSLINSGYEWINSPSDADEWYVRLAVAKDVDTNNDGTADLNTKNPDLDRPEEVLEDSIEIPEGTLGSLAVGEWAYGDNDTLGYSTIYIRLTDDTDPNAKADAFVFMKNTQDFAYLTVTAGGTRDWTSVEVDGTNKAHYPAAGDVDDLVYSFRLAIDAIGSGVKQIPTGAGNWYGNTLRITKETGGVNVDFDIKIGQAGNFSLIKGKVDKFSDLPTQGREGDILEITGEAAESNSSSYYVRYEEDTSRWIETIPDGVSFKIDPTTMPHKMTRLQDDGAGTVTGTPDQLYFFVEAIDWTDRAVGDDSSNPLPSFIGKPIEDIFFYQDSLGFAAGENVIMSQTKEYFNFFAQTTTDSLDDDPIDITIGTNSAVTIKWVFPFTNSLELIGTNRQFSLHSGTSSPALTPSNVVVDPTTSLTPTLDVRPAELGDSIYILTSGAVYASLHRYLVDPENLNTKAIDVTKHVPNFLVSVPNQLYFTQITQIEVSEDKSMIFLNAPASALTVANNSVVYVYSHFEQGGELVQSAWHLWALNTAVLSVFGDRLYSFATREQNTTVGATEPAMTHFESMVLEPRGHVLGSSNIGQQAGIYLDDMVLPSATGGSFPALTVTLPYDIWLSTGNTYAHIPTVGYPNPSLVVGMFNNLSGYSRTLTDTGFTGKTPSGSSWIFDFTISESFGASAFEDAVAGVPFTSSVFFTEPVIANQGGAIPTRSSVHLRSYTECSLGDSVLFSTGRKSRRVLVSDDILGDSTDHKYRQFTFTTARDSSATTGFSNLNAEVGVHVPCRDSEVAAYSVLTDPLTIKSYTWVANYTNNSQVT